MSASIVKRLTAVAALIVVVGVLLTLSRGTYARSDSNDADVGDAHILEFH
jgi:hypothetical protein